MVDEVPVDFGVKVSPEELAAAVRGRRGRGRGCRGGGVRAAGGCARPGAAHALRAAAGGSANPVVSTFLADDGLLGIAGVLGEDGRRRPGDRCRRSAPRSGRWRRWPTPSGTALAGRPAGVDPGADGVGPPTPGRWSPVRRTAAPDRALDRRRTGRAAAAATASRWPSSRRSAVGRAAVAAAERIGYPGGAQGVRRDAAAPVGPGGCPVVVAEVRQVGRGLRRAGGDRRAQVYVQAMAPRDRGRCRRCSGSRPTRRSARWCRSGSAGWPPNCWMTLRSRRFR